MDCQRQEDLSPSSNFLTSSFQPPSSPSSPSTPSYIPIISLSPLHDQSVEGKQTVAQAICKCVRPPPFFSVPLPASSLPSFVPSLLFPSPLFRACEDIGFFIITHHNVDSSTISEASAAATAFFDLPVDVKSSVRMNDAYPYGKERAGRGNGRTSGTRALSTRPFLVGLAF